MTTDPKTQADKFRDLARELECDEGEERFEATVKKIAPKAPGARPQEKSPPEAK